MDLKTKSFIVAALGDVGLQIVTKQKGDLVGLKDYYEIHGEIESVLIAGGLMYGLALLYEQLPFPITNFNLFIYGGIWDIIFRQSKISKTLNNTYYQNIGTPLISFIWGGLPMVLPNLF